MGTRYVMSKRVGCVGRTPTTLQRSLLVSMSTSSPTRRSGCWSRSGEEELLAGSCSVVPKLGRTGNERARQALSFCCVTTLLWTSVAEKSQKSFRTFNAFLYVVTKTVAGARYACAECEYSWRRPSRIESGHEKIREQWTRPHLRIRNPSKASVIRRRRLKELDASRKSVSKDFVMLRHAFATVVRQGDTIQWFDDGRYILVQTVPGMAEGTYIRMRVFVAKSV